MSNAFKCDHCGKFFTKATGSHVFESEVCDAEHGYVRYRTIAFIYGSKGPNCDDFYQADKEFCDACIGKIMLAAIKKEKL